MDKDGALRLAAEIRRYWRELGAPVAAWVDPSPDDENAFLVKTNLVNGLPPNTTGDQVVRLRNEQLRQQRLARRAGEY